MGAEFRTLDYLTMSEWVSEAMEMYWWVFRGGHTSVATAASFGFGYFMTFLFRVAMAEGA